MTFKYSEFEIFDVPVTRAEHRVMQERHRYPFDLLEVGQGFAIPKLCNRASLRSCATRYGQKHGKRFVIRKIDGGPCCIRIA